MQFIGYARWKMSDPKDDLFLKISEVLCDNTLKHSAEVCYSLDSTTNASCKNYERCRIWEKTLEQLQYVEQDLGKNSFLKACPGSGKTEVVGLKSAYEFKKWTKKTTGIAVLTYTNKATDVITDRILQFAGSTGISHPHYIGTIDSWIHRYILNPFAHLVTNYSGNDEDRSIRVIDKSSDADFLKNRKFSTKYSFANSGSIHANQFYYLDLECNTIYFSSGNFRIDPVRNSTPLLNPFKMELKQIKKDFWKSGFLTHEDVEIICYKILKDYPKICKLISERFKVIIIDECQDLSSHKIELFKLLKNEGSIFHLVGDLHQSIFSYNNADSKKITTFSKEGGFSEIPLTRNFRSVQSIVNVCCSLVANSEKNIGHEDHPNKKHCLVFSYRPNEMYDIPKNFSEYLMRNDFNVEESVILIRSNSNKNSLIGRTNHNITFTKRMPTALYLWSLNYIEFKKESMNLLGHFLSDFIFVDEKVNSRSFYCPHKITNYKWRLFLADLLENCFQSDSLSNLKQTWTNWRKEFNENFPKIFTMIQSRYEWLTSEKIDNIEFINTSPKGEKDLPVIETINRIENRSDTKIELSTIHSAKGKTFDTILLVSTPHSSGEREFGSGYWEHWLDKTNADGESSRFAYVASSRPKYLLAWAISEKDYDDKTKIERLKKYGFIPMGSLGIIRKANTLGQKTMEEWL